METNSIVINLTEGYEPFGRFANAYNTQNFKAFTFNGGEPHIKLDVIPTFFGDEINVMVTIKIKSFNDLGLLAVAMDALKETYRVVDSTLFLAYFPGARQDRRMVPGEPLTSKVYAEIINSMGFNDVIILDSHSDVVPAVLDKCTNSDNHFFVAECIAQLNPGFVLISPDAGANKKVLSLAKDIGVPKIVKCDKTRDVTNGNITSFDVYADDLEGADCVIVDDICDGGGTFLGLASALKAKNAGKLYLIVSHGIFSRGLEGFTDFEKVFCTDSFFDPKDNQWPDKLEVMELKNIIRL